MLDGPQSQFGHCGIEKYFLPLPGIEPWPSSPQYVVILVPQPLYCSIRSEVSGLKPRCHYDRTYRSEFPEMNCPAQSPDPNATEHVWDELERRLRSGPQRPQSLPALATALQEAGAAIPPETFRHLVESLSGRVRAVIKAHPVLMSTTGKSVIKEVGLQFRVGVRILSIR
jgi:hypothetical protein